MKLLNTLLQCVIDGVAVDDGAAAGSGADDNN